MSFNRPAGPPATRQQVNTLLALLRDAGHEDFRDARGPMGFTQRQAGGKFTSDEAESFIDQLENAGHEPEQPVHTIESANSSGWSQAKLAAAHRLPTELLAAELQRRGWIVIEP
jgi:hypothetical protein